MSYLHYGIFLNDNPISITDQIGIIPNINEIDIIINQLNELKSKGQDYINKYNKNIWENVYRDIGCPPCEEKRKEKIIKIGYIYIIEDLKNNLFKIGITRNNVKDRLNSMQTSTPNKLIIVYEKKIKNYIIMESHFHFYFKSKNISGEWFKLNNEDIKYIKDKIKKSEKLHGKIEI